MMDTTLGEIRSYGPCEDRWEHLMEHLDPRPAEEEPFPVSKVLEVNGLDDTLWLLSQMGERRLLVRFAVDCAERAVERYWEPRYPDDRRPQDAIEAARAWVNDPTEESMERARAAGRDALAAACADETAEVAAAARAAARAAAHAAATTYWCAYWAPAAAAARTGESAWQVERLRKYLEGER